MLIEIPLKYCEQGCEDDIKYIFSSHIVSFSFYEYRHTGNHTITDGKRGDYTIHIEYKRAIINLSDGNFLRLGVRTKRGKRKEVDNFEKEYLIFLEKLEKTLMKLK